LTTKYWKGIKNWGIGLEGGIYNTAFETKGNITCTGDKLLFSANLCYYPGSDVFIDNRFKFKNINDDWNNINEGQIIKRNISNYKKSPPLSFNATTQKGILGFINYSNMNYYSNVRDFINEQSYLDDPVTIGTTYTTNYIGGISGSTLQGDCFLYKSQQAYVSYIISRRPSYIIGNIIYNSLLTGNEFIGKSENPVCHTAGAKVIANPGSVTTITGNSQFIVDQGDVIEFKPGSTLNILDNAQLIIDGSSASMILNPNVSINLGANAKITIRNNAYLIANGSNISSVNSSTPGKGFYFENAGQNTITGCTFTNLKNPIYINGNSGFFGDITNNTFNEDGTVDYSYVIECKNVNNITISDNNIIMQPSKGIGILFRYPYSSGKAASSTTIINSNIINNDISNGAISAAFVCLTNSYEEINFIHNNCYGNVSTSNINTRHITGDIKDNSISSNSGRSLELNQSNPNVYHNTFGTSNVNILNSDSYPKLAPISESGTDGGWVWYGGRNYIISSSNINTVYNGGIILLDWGENCFSTTSNYAHLSGYVNETSPYYFVRYNDFNGNPLPRTYLNDGTLLPYTAQPYFQCNYTFDAGTIWQIRNLGNGIYDTIYKTSKNSGYEPSQDEALYSMANLKMESTEYFNAISYFKSLITGFPESSYTDGCLYSLYKCYQSLDTSSNPGIKNALYADLINYLNGRISSGQYSEDFNLNAYNITLMCYTSNSNLGEAMEGYEFIALYHPDAYIRLLASWDYAEVQELLNGSGGLSSKEENLTDAEYFSKLTKRVNKGINEDPIKKKVKKSFDKVKTEKTSKIEKRLSQKRMI